MLSGLSGEYGNDSLCHAVSKVGVVPILGETLRQKEVEIIKNDGMMEFASASFFVFFVLEKQHCSSCAMTRRNRT